MVCMTPMTWSQVNRASKKSGSLACRLSGMVAVLLGFCKAPQEWWNSFATFFFLLEAVQEFFSISFVLHASFSFQQALAGNFFQNHPPFPQELNCRPLITLLFPPFRFALVTPLIEFVTYRSKTTSTLAHLSEKWETTNVVKLSLHSPNDFAPVIFAISKIQLVVYYQYCVLIGWATSRLFVIAH